MSSTLQDAVRAMVRKADALRARVDSVLPDSTEILEQLLIRLKKDFDSADLSISKKSTLNDIKRIEKELRRRAKS